MTDVQGLDRTTTAIIATYNRARYIGEAIDSILGQVEPPGQLIVVDDGSDDDTPTVVANYGRRVEYLRKENGGKSSAINLGLKLARHHWVWLFDDDDIALPGATKTLLDALASAPDAEFAFSGQIVAEDDGSGKLEVRRTIVPQIENMEGLLFELLQAYRFQMQSMLIKREALQRIGAMDERFLRGQDYELMIRLARNLKGVQVSQPTFIWRQHPGERGPKKLRHGEGDRGKLWSHFERLLGSEVRAHLALGEFLVPPRREEPSESERSAALIHRAAIMATKGLIEEFTQDLREAAALPPDRPLTPPQRKVVLGAAFNQRFTARFAEDPQAAMSGLASITSGPLARDVWASISRALLFESRHGARARSERARLFACAVALAWRAGPTASLRIWRNQG